MAEILNSPSTTDNIGPITWKGGDSVIRCNIPKPTQCYSVLSKTDKSPSHLPIIEQIALIYMGCKDDWGIQIAFNC